MNPDLAALPSLPRDAEGPVFREPWEAQAFAMVIALHRRGAFTWTEWASALNRGILDAQARGDPDLGDTYYRHWLEALESLVLSKGLASDAELHAREDRLRAAPAPGHDHVAQRGPVHVDAPRS